MSYSTASGREQILDDLGAAVEHLGAAVARLGEAYEEMDEQSAERLEQQLFRPLQAAYGVAKRTHADFSKRYGISTRELEPSSAGLPAPPREEIERAAEEIRVADATLADLQDSMLPVEVGDQELRAGLTRVRELIASLPAQARETVRTLGR